MDAKPSTADKRYPGQTGIYSPAPVVPYLLHGRVRLILLIWGLGLVHLYSVLRTLSDTRGLRGAAEHLHLFRVLPPWFAAGRRNFWKINSLGRESGNNLKENVFVSDLFFLDADRTVTLKMRYPRDSIQATM
jgi:hypothetical protein